MQRVNGVLSVTKARVCGARQIEAASAWENESGRVTQLGARFAVNREHEYGLQRNLIIIRRLVGWLVRRRALGQLSPDKSVIARTIRLGVPTHA